MKKINEERMKITEMSMLLWVSGVTREGRISNIRIRGAVKVAAISKKTQETRLRQHGCVIKRN